MDELYTKIFVDIEREHAYLISAVASACSGKIEGWTVVCEPYEIDVRPNESRGVERSLAPEDQFLDFRFTVEVVDEAGENRAAYISFVAALMTELYGIGACLVAACDFEEELPGHGTLLHG